MSAQVFALPDLGEGLTEAELVGWLVAVGDTITIDQPIAEVETAKSVVEVPSPFAGTVSVLHGEPGELITVGAPLIEVSAGADATAAQAAAGAAKDETAGPESVAVDLEPEHTGGSGHVLVGYGTSEAVHTGRRRRRAVGPHAPVLPEAAPQPSPAPRASARVAVISPVVRQLAKARGLDLARITPTGAGGVVTRHDLDAADSRMTRQAEGAAGGGLDARTGLRIASTTPFGMFRKTVAQAMSRSRSEIPEATVWVDTDATELWRLRERMAARGQKTSLLAFLAIITLGALARYPVLAGRVADDGAGVIEFTGVNLGFAADTPRGLMVPVVRHAEALSLGELNETIADLSSQARAGELAPQAVTGSTFTLNNYGSLGVDGSAAIINYPEVAILGIGRVIQRPWVVDGDIVPRRIAQLSLVFDHRVCDGGTAAAFLRAIADAVEDPYALMSDIHPAR